MNRTLSFPPSALLHPSDHRDHDSDARRHTPPTSHRRPTSDPLAPSHPVLPVSKRPFLFQYHTSNDDFPRHDTPFSSSPEIHPWWSDLEASPPSPGLSESIDHRLIVEHHRVSAGFWTLGTASTTLRHLLVTTVMTAALSRHFFRSMHSAQPDTSPSPTAPLAHTATYCLERRT